MKEKTFSLKECLTDKQKEAGFVSSIPDGIDVLVNLSVKKEVARYKEKDNNVLLTSTTYTTEVSSVQIGNQSGDDAATVTNTLNLKTSVNIPVTKIADGIAAGSFKFGFKKIDNIGEVVNDLSNPTALKQANSLIGIATSGDATVKETKQLADSTKQVVEDNTVSFDTEEYTAPGTYWYAIAEQSGGTQNVASGVDYDGTAYLVKVDVTLSTDKRSLKARPTIYKAATGATALEDATTVVSSSKMLP